MKSLADMQLEVYANNVAHGWFDADRSVGDECSLLVSEVSEAFEEARKGRIETYYTEGGKPEGFKSELADILIRLLDTCHRYGVQLEEEYEIKMKFNKSRSYRHGNKTV